MCVCKCVSLLLCVCVCVCVRERERERNCIWASQFPTYDTKGVRIWRAMLDMINGERKFETLLSLILENGKE